MCGTAIFRFRCGCIWRSFPCRGTSDHCVSKSVNISECRYPFYRDDWGTTLKTHCGRVECKSFVKHFGGYDAVVCLEGITPMLLGTKPELGTPLRDADTIVVMEDRARYAKDISAGCDTSKLVKLPKSQAFLKEKKKREMGCALGLGLGKGLKMLRSVVVVLWIWRRPAIETTSLHLRVNSEELKAGKHS